MRTFLQQKLWRDKMIERAENNWGSIISWRHLDEHEFKEKLNHKLQEEVSEVITARTQEQRIAELADLYEVIDTLLATYNIKKEDVFAAQQKKQSECGGFISRKFIETATHTIGSDGEKYCLNDPEKYPEIALTE